MCALPRPSRTIPLLAIALATACSSSTPPTAPLTAGSLPESGSSVAGRVVDQFSGAGLSGIVVRFGGVTAVTDAEGRFMIAGAPSGGLRTMMIAGETIHDRETYVSGGEVRLEVVPSGFDMEAFHDVGREHSARTIRWLASPTIYLDTRVTGGAIDPADLDAWVTEIQTLAPSIVTEWTGGAIVGAPVVVGDSPPASGAIVLKFDEDPTGYPTERVAGMTATTWSPDGVIGAARIRFRFSGIGGPAGAYSRRAVIAHEIGHALGLSHMDGETPSIMTPVIRTPLLTDFDRAAGRILYGRPPGNTTLDRDTRAVTAGARGPAAAWVTTSEAGASLPALAD